MPPSLSLPVRIQESHLLGIRVTGNILEDEKARDSKFLIRLLPVPKTLAVCRALEHARQIDCRCGNWRRHLTRRLPGGAEALPFQSVHWLEIAGDIDRRLIV